MHERKSQSARRLLTAAQERALLHKHLTGAFPPGCRWTTVRALIRAGMVVLVNQHAFVVTAQGKAYCESHVMDLRPFLQPSSEVNRRGGKQR